MQTCCHHVQLHLTLCCLIWLEAGTEKSNTVNQKSKLQYRHWGFTSYNKNKCVKDCTSHAVAWQHAKTPQWTINTDAHSVLMKRRPSNEEEGTVAEVISVEKYRHDVLFKEACTIHCNRVYCIHVPGHDPITFSFRSFSFLIGWGIYGPII